MSRRLTIKEAEERCTDMVRGQKWKGNHAKYLYLCESHGEYQQIFSSHDRGQGCPECGGSKPLTLEKAETRHIDMIKGQTWRGSHAKYLYLCESHGEYLQKFDDHDGSHGCHKCGHYKAAQIRSLTIKEAEKRHPDFVKGQIWKGNKAKYVYLCKNHGEYLQKFNSHDQGRGCNLCGGTKLLTTKEAENKYSDLVKGQAWKGANNRYWYKCETHGKYHQLFNNHSQGVGCPDCNEPRGEKKVAAILKALGVTFKKQWRIPECRNSRPLPFDFTVEHEEKRYLIEFQGHQHYFSVECFGGDKAFEQLRHRDKIKKTFCKNNKIPLLIIKYTEKNIEAAIRSFLGKSNQ